MRHIAIVAGGPMDRLPKLKEWQVKIDAWIGADYGAYLLSDVNIMMEKAVGDFDSVTQAEFAKLSQSAKEVIKQPAEKDETDLEIAINQAISYQPEKIYLFGVTGGRLDHELINLQLLEKLLDHDIQGVIVDHQNEIELYRSGAYTVDPSEDYQYYSFVASSENVRHLTLTGFKYPLNKYNLVKGSTRCISNELGELPGQFSFIDGQVYLIKSKG